MASFPPEEFAADGLRDLLNREHGLTHLRVRRRGKVITIESGPAGDPFPHARVRRDTAELYTLEMPTPEFPLTGYMRGQNRAPATEKSSDLSASR